jgi:glycosyltransferase involved in cell wall biosynthesis
VSVIVPARNERIALPATLRAIETALARLGPRRPAEVIVADSASIDGTDALVDDRPGVRRIACQRPGAAHARNCGAKAARGDLLVFVDADTLLPPAGLRRAVCLARAGYAVALFPLAPLRRSWRGRRRCRRTCSAPASPSSGPAGSMSG